MTSPIESFGGAGPHEVHFRADNVDQALWVKRDLWFDNADGTGWLVWVQHRSWEHDDPPTEGDAEAASLGSIVVTHPAVMAFIEQLGTLLVDPVKFKHGPTFAADPLPADPMELPD